MADYWLIRRGRINVPDFYTESPLGAYFYKKGFNPKAIIAMVPAVSVALLIAFIPAFAAADPFAWFFAAGIAAVVYYLISGRREHPDAVAGDAIASTH